VEVDHDKRWTAKKREAARTEERVTVREGGDTTSQSRPAYAVERQGVMITRSRGDGGTSDGEGAGVATDGGKVWITRLYNRHIAPVGNDDTSGYVTWLKTLGLYISS